MSNIDLYKGLNMMKTNYTIRKERDSYSAYLEDKVISKGCITEEDCLHSIWVTEGKVFDDFYVVDSAGVVVRIDRGEL